MRPVGVGASFIRPRRTANAAIETIREAVAIKLYECPFIAKQLKLSGFDERLSSGIVEENGGLSFKER